jgi:hypothetical protein
MENNWAMGEVVKPNLKFSCHDITVELVVGVVLLCEVVNL